MRIVQQLSPVCTICFAPDPCAFYVDDQKQPSFLCPDCCVALGESLRQRGRDVVITAVPS